MQRTKLERLEAAELMKGVLLLIVEALVDNPRGIHIGSEEVNGTTRFRLQVSPSDVGKLIGKQGRTARSIRTVLSAAGLKYRQRFALDILEEG